MSKFKAVCYTAIANWHSFHNKGILLPTQASDSQSMWASTWPEETSLSPEDVLCTSDFEGFTRSRQRAFTEGRRLCQDERPVGLWEAAQRKGLAEF